MDDLREKMAAAIFERVRGFYPQGRAGDWDRHQNGARKTQCRADAEAALAALKSATGLTDEDLEGLMSGKPRFLQFVEDGSAGFSTHEFRPGPKP